MRSYPVFSACSGGLSASGPVMSAAGIAALSGSVKIAAVIAVKIAGFAAD